MAFCASHFSEGLSNTPSPIADIRTKHKASWIQCSHICFLFKQQLYRAVQNATLGQHFALQMLPGMTN